MSDPGRNEPIWLTETQVRILHAEALGLFGGALGVRDRALLESALARPKHLWNYRDDATLFELSASYGFGLAKNHAFVDGNKRVALLAIRVFLFRNGYLFSPDEMETVSMMEGIASGAVTEELLADWIAGSCVERR
ncbi:MAG: type II toxin-antitoxin system death-on-curing family toxin [Rhodothermales bacterium]